MKPVDVLRQVLSYLEKLNIVYMVAGSFASSLYAPARFTQDVDLIVNLIPAQAADLFELLRGDFYVDRGMIEQALTRGTAFNIIHIETSFKVDFFILRNKAFDQEAFSRRQFKPLDTNLDVKTYVQSPEDIVLSKLDWYRMGGEVSENQWRDVTGILKTQAGRLDLTYIRRWAAELEIADLLERALGQTGIGEKKPDR